MAEEREPEVTGHERVASHFRKFNTANRQARANKPAPTMISNAPDTAPLVREARLGGDGEYAALLSRELPELAPASCGMSLASFFCCGGGIDLGFRSVGFETAFANDIHKAAAVTFERNLGHRPLLRDIREVGPDDYPAGPVDVVTGGFPCVTFSMAGRRAGVTDDENGKLYLELCRVISEIRPRYFVAENVKGMLSANGGQAIKLVLAAFLRLGYRTSYEAVNMADFGVPQARERVIFVGVRTDEWRGSFQFPKRTHRRAEDKAAKRWLPLARTLRYAIGDLPPLGERVRVVSGHEANSALVVPTYKTTQRVAKGGKPCPTLVSNNPNVQPHVREGELRGARNPDFNNPMKPADGPAPTMTAGGAAEVLRGSTLRRMTARECARVQSFPDWYVFEGSQSDQYRIIGNAVPPLYAKALARAILDYDARPAVG